jgi:5-oxoprolinase (ATP-hydrolysing) subunit A
VDTICVHGDTPDAAVLAARIRTALEEAGIEIRPVGSR